MGSFLKRLSEPSTYAGLAAVIFGGGQLAGWDQAEQVATTVASAGQTVVEQGASTESLIVAGAGLLTGLLAIFKGEGSK